MRRRRRSDEGNDSHERWLVSYADFITLLFAFFVVLYATSEQDDNKSKKFEESVKKYLLKIGSALGGQGSIINTGSKNRDPIAEPIETFKKRPPSKLQKKIETHLEENLTEKEWENIVKR